MNIGIHYTYYIDACYLLHGVQHGEIISEKHNYFEIKIDKDIYRFTTHYENIEDCDIKIRTCSEWNLRYKDQHLYNKIVHSIPGEPYEFHVSDEEILEFLNKGNICLSGGSVPYLQGHENFFFDPKLALIYFYHFYGFDFLNYYPNNQKSHLLGVYHKPIHINKRQTPMRNYIVSAASKALKNDFHIYSKSWHYKIRPVIESYLYFGDWGKNHISGYTDYNTSVCNIIYETYDSWTGGGGPYNGRIHLTEKTLKSIIFCESDIFFIWYGPLEFYKYLTDLGFWFLNSEFYKESSDESIWFNDPSSNNTEVKISITPIEKSVTDTISYLKKLKNTLVNNSAIYDYLIKSYGHKLKNNVKLFRQMLSNYDKKEDIIRLIKK